MKKKVLPFIGLLLISVLSATVLSSCDKDTWCYLEVTVLDSKKDNMPAPGAWIRVRYIKNNPDNPDNPVFGTIDTITQCDASGVARTKLAAPAIFTILARIDEPDTVNHKFYYRQGERSVRLKPGEVVATSVKVTGDKTLGRADFQEL